MGLGEPFEHGVADDQVEAAVELLRQGLPGGLDEGGLAAGFGEALAGAVKHRFGRFGEGYLVAALGQPEAHVAEPGADVEHPQGAFGQGFAEVGLEHGEADGALGAAVDLLREARGEGVEMAVVGHGRKRRSLSASLSSTAWFMSMPSSLHISSR